MRRDNVNSEDEYRKERKERYSCERRRITRANIQREGKYYRRDAPALHVDEIIKGKLFSSPRQRVARLYLL